MFDSKDLVKAMKRAAVEAVNASKPANIVFGKVIQEKPLKIKIDQKLILNEAQLVLARNVTDHEIEVTIKSDYGWETQTKGGGSGEASFASHDHSIQHDRKKLFIHNKLLNGEEVILIQIAGGQEYIVLDRLEEGAFDDSKNKHRTNSRP